MNFRHYVFHSEWDVDAPIEDVFAVLHDQSTYSSWWPEVREVREVDHDHHFVRTRSLLPYWLEFTSEVQVDDHAGYVLEARLNGDLVGTVRWTLSPRAGGTHIDYDQEVETNKRLLNVLAPVARPAFRANHALMMRNGRRGLQTFLAGVGFEGSDVTHRR